MRLHQLRHDLVALACSFNRDLLRQATATFSDEVEPLEFNHMFAPVLDLGRELHFGRVEDFGEDLCEHHLSTIKATLVF